MHASIPNAEATSAACGVASHALVQATLAEIPGLREKPSPEGMPSLAMLRTAGGVAVSPHIVPQCSLHSGAGAVSVAFGRHGPNIGVGGGQHAVAETGAIRRAFGAAVERVPVSSTKSLSGHLVSGAAAFEAVACLAAIAHQAVPPTVNLDNPDPQCQLDHVPHVARERSVRVTASNSFGFGGANLCLVIRGAV